MRVLLADGERCDVQSHGGTSQGKLREAVHALHIFFVDVCQGIKVLHLPSNVTGIRTGVETSNTANTTFAFQQGLPCGPHPCSQRCDQPHAGDDDPPPYVSFTAGHSRATSVDTSHL